MELHYLSELKIGSYFFAAPYGFEFDLAPENMPFERE